MKRISIHALREEGDDRSSWREIVPRIFLSTPSARRATSAVQVLDAMLNISIHALREEGDILWIESASKIPSISIHALREEGDALSVAASGAES